MRSKSYGCKGREGAASQRQGQDRVGEWQSREISSEKRWMGSTWVVKKGGGSAASCRGNQKMRLTTQHYRTNAPLSKIHRTKMAQDTCHYKVALLPLVRVGKFEL
jgi:hypothetical protein